MDTNSLGVTHAMTRFIMYSGMKPWSHRSFVITIPATRKAATCQRFAPAKYMTPIQMAMSTSVVPRSLPASTRNMGGAASEKKHTVNSRPSRMRDPTSAQYTARHAMSTTLANSDGWNCSPSREMKPLAPKMRGPSTRTMTSAAKVAQYSACQACLRRP